MLQGRRKFLQAGAAVAARPLRSGTATARPIPLALVQFDAVPEQVDRNTSHVERLTAQAVAPPPVKWSPAPTPTAARRFSATT